MKIAIVGSRNYPALSHVRSYVMHLPPGTTVVSGGARGVDREAEQVARSRGLAVEVYPADWSKGLGAGFERNTKIVEACDFVVAFWDGHSKGTMDTVNKARAAGKPAFVVEPEWWDLTHPPLPLQD